MVKSTRNEIQKVGVSDSGRISRLGMKVSRLGGSSRLGFVISRLGPRVKVSGFK